LKKVRKGRDKAIGRDTTDDAGRWKLRVRKAHGRYYAVAKVLFYSSNGRTETCKKGKSPTIKP
jgi:hypothetical protein